MGRDQNTLCLNSLGSGDPDPAALDALVAATYQELRRLAGGIMSFQPAPHTLQPTALVNEAYLRLFRVDEISVSGRTHFMNLAARVMRQVLVDHARRRNSAKRGGGWRAVTLTGIGLAAPDDRLDMLALDAALADLEAEDARAARVVELRIFGALTMEEIAQDLGLTRRTVQKDWRYATLWLRRALGREAAS
jgi:RNA polymerase sigma factor (TIGR02999 family)